MPVWQFQGLKKKAEHRADSNASSTGHASYTGTKAMGTFDVSSSLPCLQLGSGSEARSGKSEKLQEQSVRGSRGGCDPYSTGSPEGKEDTGPWHTVSVVRLRVEGCKLPESRPSQY